MIQVPDGYTELVANDGIYFAVGANVKWLKGESDKPPFRVEIRSKQSHGIIESDAKYYTEVIIPDLSEMVCTPPNRICGIDGMVRLKTTRLWVKGELT